jgi:hypothetical protein
MAQRLTEVLGHLALHWHVIVGKTGRSLRQRRPGTSQVIGDHW